MKTRLSLAVDAAFAAFVSFILSLVFFNYFFDRAFTITFATISSALVTLFSVKKLIDKNESARLSKSQLREKAIMTAQLNLYTTTEQNDLFEKLLSRLNVKHERKRGFLYVKENSAAIFPRFCFDGVTKTDIVKIFNTINKGDTAYILSDKFSPEIKEFADRFSGRIITVGADQVYTALSENLLLPRAKFSFPEKKPLKLSALKNIFEKRKAKTHLIFGVTFLLMSYFVPIKIYYVICGCIFLLLALFCRLYGRAEKNIQTA